MVPLRFFAAACERALSVPPTGMPVHNASPRICGPGLGWCRTATRFEALGCVYLETSPRSLRFRDRGPVPWQPFGPIFRTGRQSVAGRRRTFLHSEIRANSPVPDESSSPCAPGPGQGSRYRKHEPRLKKTRRFAGRTASPHKRRGTAVLEIRYRGSRGGSSGEGGGDSPVPPVRTGRKLVQEARLAARSPLSNARVVAAAGPVA